MGNYIAKVWFTTPQGGIQRDELAAGSFLTLNLTLDGLVSGRLHMAALGTNPVVDADMAGTWNLNGKDVTFTQTADTFVRNMTLTIYQFDDKHWYLAGNQVISGTRFNLGLWPP